MLETAPTADVVDEDCAGGAAVVGAGDGAEALGAGCVPELEFYAFAVGRLADAEGFGGEFYADGLGGEDAPCAMFTRLAWGRERR